MLLLKTNHYYCLLITGSATLEWDALSASAQASGVKRGRDCKWD